jgi:predicted metal-dependent hydrolase
MNRTRRIDMLRSKYRSLWDTHQILADHNARQRQVDKQPSNEELINEQRAAEAVQLARAELLAAISRSES